MQTSVQKSQSVRFWNGILKINNVNVGLLKDAKLNVDYSIMKVRAHNGVLPPKKKPTSVKFSASLYELYLPNMAYLEGHGVLSNTAASSVNITAETIATAWTQSQPIKIAGNKNGDNTIVTSITIKRNGTALTAGTDYRTYVGNGINGELWYTYVTPITTQSAGTFTADYTYVPNAKRTYTISDLTKALTYYSLTFENVDENGKKFTVTIPQGYSSGNMELGYPSDDAEDGVLMYPFEFTADANASNQLLIIDDEQAATA